MNRRKLLIFGNYGGINFGDEAILSGLLYSISSKKWQITVVSANPEHTRKHHKVNSVYQPPFGFRSLFRGKFLETVRAIKEADLVLFGGGGLFQDKEPRAFLMWSLFLRLCFLFNKRIALIANSIGPLNKGSSIDTAKQIFKKVSFFSVRDQDSFDLLESLAVDKRKISFGTDAVFFLPIKKQEKKHKEILLILHGKYTTERQIKRIKKFVQYLKKKGEKVAFLPMQKRITNDHKLAKKLNIPCYSPKSDKEIVEIISSAKFVLSSRLHGAIIAMLTKTPFVAFAEMPKVKSFLASSDMNKFFIQSNFTSERLIKIFNQYKKGGTKIRKEIEKVARVEKKKTKFILPDFI